MVSLIVLFYIGVLIVVIACFCFCLEFQIIRPYPNNDSHPPS